MATTRGGINKQQSAINGDVLKEGGGGEMTMVAGGEVVWSL